MSRTREMAAIIGLGLDVEEVEAAAAALNTIPSAVTAAVATIDGEEAEAVTTIDGEEAAALNAVQAARVAALAAVDAADETAVAAAAAASASASTATDHASTATTKAGEAATSATAAAGSASTASGHASTATTKASEAAASATTATTKAGEASASAATAATEADDAATSATAAAGSATTAAGSVTAAANSATLAENWATSLSVVSGGFYGARKYAQDAAQSAIEAAAAADFDPADYVQTAAVDQTVAGLKTFSNGIIINGQTIDGVTAAGLTLMEAADASAQRTALALVPGTNVQAYDAKLAAFSGLTGANNSFAYFTGASTMATATVSSGARSAMALTMAGDRFVYWAGAATAVAGTITAAGRAILDDADATAQRATLGLVIGTNVQAYSVNLDEYAAVNPTPAGLALLDDADATAQRATLGLVVGTDVQGYDADLAAIAGLTSAADRLPYFTGSGTAALATFTSAARSLLDDATASDMRTTLGLVIGSNVQAYNADLAAIAGLTSAADKLPYFSGAGAASLADFTAAGRTIAGAADAAAQRTALGLVIGTNVQAYDAELAAIAGLTSAADRLPYFTGSGTAALATFSAAGRALADDADATAQRTTLGLGDIATRSKTTAAQLRALSTDVAVTVDMMAAAMAAVALTAGTTVSVDWAAGYFFTLAAAQNFTLANPTNVTAGSTRIIYVVGNDATDRTITYGSNYKGALTAITDIDSAKGYLITLFAVSATHIVPTSVRAL